MQWNPRERERRSMTKLLKEVVESKTGKGRQKPGKYGDQLVTISNKMRSVPPRTYMI